MPDVSVHAGPGCGHDRRVLCRLADLPFHTTSPPFHWASWPLSFLRCRRASKPSRPWSMASGRTFSSASRSPWSILDKPQEQERTADMVKLIGGQSAVCEIARSVVDRIGASHVIRIGSLMLPLPVGYLEGSRRAQETQSRRRHRF